MRLLGYPKFHTHDPDEADARLSVLLRRYHGNLLSRRFELTSYSATLDTLVVTSNQTIARRQLTADADDRWYVMNFQQQGARSIASAGGERVVSPGSGTLYVPLQESVTEVAGDDDEPDELLIVRIPVSVIHDPAEPLVRRPLSAPLQLTGTLDQSSVPGRILEAIVKELEDPFGAFSSGSLAHEIGRHLERALVSALILATPNTYRPLLQEEAVYGYWRARVVARAEEYMDAHLTVSVTTSDLAQAAVVGPRSLQESFAVIRGIPPKTVLRHKRLEAARRELETPSLATVAAIASKYVFRAPAFGTYYQERYGETPGETRKRATGSLT